MALTDVDTIVIAILENRSFDHSRPVTPFFVETGGPLIAALVGKLPLKTFRIRPFLFR
jgi:hypothetical protein